MDIFTKLKKLRDFEKRRLPFLKTLNDFDILHEVGLHQFSGSPLTLSDLFRLDIAGKATVQRRLSRLKKLGVIVEIKALDQRLKKLCISAPIKQSYLQYQRLWK